jgi:hypothetical protein
MRAVRTAARSSARSPARSSNSSLSAYRKELRGPVNQDVLATVVQCVGASRIAPTNRPAPDDRT